MPDEKTPQPQPLTITNLEPASAHVGDPALMVHVIGTGFTPNSLITVDRANLIAIIYSDTDVSTLIDPSERSMPGMLLVTVKNGSEESNSLSFNLLPPLTEGQKAEKAEMAEKAKAMETKPEKPKAPPPPFKAAPSPTVPPRTAPSKK